MSNALYNKARQSFLAGSPTIDWDSDTIKCTPVGTGYVFNQSHQYMNTDTVPLAQRITAPQTLAGKSGADGIADANDLSFPAVSVAQIKAFLIWKDGGGSGTTASGTQDPLIAYIDTGGNLPVNPNGGQIDVAIDNGANKLFVL